MVIGFSDLRAAADGAELRVCALGHGLAGLVRGAGGGRHGDHATARGGIDRGRLVGHVVQHGGAIYASRLNLAWKKLQRVLRKKSE